jgi:hypothetical protein
MKIATRQGGDFSLIGSESWIRTNGLRVMSLPLHLFCRVFTFAKVFFAQPGPSQFYVKPSSAAKAS